MEKKKKYENEMRYLNKYFSDPLELEGIIFKLDATDFGVTNGGDDYEKITGVDFLEEKTLIVGDDDNNSYLIFNKEKEEVDNNHVTDKVHILDKFYYDSESFIRKKHEPTNLPEYLRPFIIIKNEINITNNIINSSITNVNDLKYLRITEMNRIEDFLERNYERGGMYPLRDMKRHLEWIPKYRESVEVKRLQICKSCGGRSVKGCCERYSRKNRSMITMVIGWYKLKII